MNETVLDTSNHSQAPHKLSVPMKDMHLSPVIADVTGKDVPKQAEPEITSLDVPGIHENGDGTGSPSKQNKSKNRLSFRQRAKKRFGGGLNQELSANQDTSSMKSNRGVLKQEESTLVRKRSFMRRLTYRRRTLRSSGAHINRAPGYESYSKKNGYVLSGDEKLRMFTLKEIVNTEEEYTKLLQFMVEVIIPALKECAADGGIKSVDENTIDHMLSNIEDIYDFHVKFNAALKKATYPYPYYTHCIGEVFLRHEREFHVYEQYCSNYKTAQKLSYQLEAEPKVKALVDSWKRKAESKTRKFIHLEGFLISPVQRLCKYPLFLKELAKYTKENHPDHKHVLAAKQMMEVVTTAVNEAERRKIIVEALQDLEAASDSWEKDGCVSKQGFMTKRSHWFKFWNIQWFIVDGFEMCHYNQPTDTKPSGQLDLRMCKRILEDAYDYTGKPFSFAIEVSDRNHFMYCTSEQERQEWLTILQWKLSCVERSRRQAAKPIEAAVITTISSLIYPSDSTVARRSMGLSSKSIDTFKTNSPRKVAKLRAKSASTII